MDDIDNYMMISNQITHGLFHDWCGCLLMFYSELISMYYSIIYWTFLSPHRSSIDNVLLLFNPSFIILTPKSPILLSFFFILYHFLLSFSPFLPFVSIYCFFYFFHLYHYHSDTVQLMYCYLSIFHLSFLLLNLQYCSLFISCQPFSLSPPPSSCLFLHYFVYFSYLLHHHPD